MSVIGDKWTPEDDYILKEIHQDILLGPVLEILDYLCRFWPKIDLSSKETQAMIL